MKKASHRRFAGAFRHSPRGKVLTAYSALSPATGHHGFGGPVLEKKWATGAYFHYLHHRYFECNYGDNVLPLDSDDAARFVRELKEALDERRVGRFAFSMQLRADVATPAVVDALVELESRVFATDRLSRRSLRQFLTSASAAFMVAEGKGLAGTAIVPKTFVPLAGGAPMVIDGG